MLRFRNVRCLRQQLPLLRHISSTPPTNREVKPPRAIFEQLTEKIFVDDLITRSGRRPFVPLVEEPIIARKFFNGQVDDNQLMYPEVLTPQRFEALNEIRWNVDEFILDKLRFDASGVTHDVHTSFQQMKLYGYNVPTEYGGQGYVMSELALLSEPEGQNAGVALSLNAHRQACEIINRYCSDEQRAKYLPRLATGELVATVAFDEFNENELKTVRTFAELDDDTDEWCLKGDFYAIFSGALLFRLEISRIPVF